MVEFHIVQFFIIERFLCDQKKIFNGLLVAYTCGKYSDDISLLLLSVHVLSAFKNLKIIL